MILLEPEPGMQGDLDPARTSRRPARPNPAARRPGRDRARDPARRRPGSGPPGRTTWRPPAPRPGSAPTWTRWLRCAPSRPRSRPATPAEQAVLARWSGWGAVPAVFDDKHAELAWAREELARLLSGQEMAAAARNTLNAHYTDAAIVQAIWDAIAGLGFTGGRVLEPGCGQRQLHRLRPGGADITGVELDPVTAGIAAALYPGARILCESFADTRLPDDHFDLAIGNVPFAPGRAARLADTRHNPGRQHSIHNHFILKALHLTRPAGWSPCSPPGTRWTARTRRPAGRWPPWPTWSPRSGCRPGRSSAPPAPPW